ncbi:natterin-3-like [Megalobrama amblycephala]|uniref:natterin-3-like n=1 Tax=Megalobrama amblycephala TaxID=75352 RepID=UPI002013E1D4|nr:natterin-3-like [Megalobrama amblycephala]
MVMFIIIFSCLFGDVSQILIMGFSVIIIFALLQIRLLNAGVNPEDLSNIERTDSSNPHQRHARALPLKKLFAGKDKEDRSILDPNTYLELVDSKTPPEDAYTFFHKEKEYYIIQTGKCNEFKLEILDKFNANDKEHQFLVNKDNFEDLEWKTWADIESSKTPFAPVWICEHYYIAKDESGKPSLTKQIDKTKKKTEYLYLNNDKLETLDMHSEDPVQKTPGNIEVLKQFIFVNKNCKSAKHVVKLDQGSDESSSSQKGRTHAFGGSASGGSLNLKYDYSRSNTITTSNVDKMLHSWNMEIEVPPNHSCSIKVTSKTFTSTVQYSYISYIYR